MNLNDRRRALVRHEIEQAAVELFEQQGYEATTVEQIAERAGIAVRTFYRHCDGKVGAITAMLPEGPERLVHRIAELESRPLAEALRIALAESVGDDDEQLIRRMMRLISSEPALRGRWLEAGRAAQHALQEPLARRLGGAQLEAEALAAAAIAVLTVALQRWAHDGGDLSALTRAALTVLRLDDA